MADVEIKWHGPMFDSRGGRAVDAFLDDAKQDIARQGKDLVTGGLMQVIRHPTPYYWTQITYERRGADWRVHDNRVIYGHWLEGTGSRNKTTRFKGYATFRRMTQILKGMATGIAERVLDRHIGKMR